LYTLEFRSACGNPILAYEPQPFLFKLLQWNIQLNELRDVEARNIACGSERGDATFSLGLNGSLVTESAKGAVPKPVISDTKSPWEEQEFLTRSGAIITVPVTTLDDDLAGHSSIALLKIDCEGFEYHIIQGARELLKRHRPILFIEVHPEQIRQFGHSTEALLELLAPDYEFEFWYFRVGRHGSKLARSLAKFRRPQGVRFADAAEMLRAAGSTPGPAQIYWLGRPQPNKGPR
jgi:FkbM family methyltransferase